MPLLVFDWDGTLANSHAKIVGCFAGTIAALGEEPLPEQTLRNVIGLGLPQTALALFPEASDEFVARFVAAYRDHWLAPGAAKAKLFEGARDCLETLRARGFRSCVATGKSRAGLDRELTETGLEGMFLATRCADETESKPSPKMLLELLEQTSTSAADALVIGDTTFDLEMAQLANVPRVGVSYGAHSRARLQAFEPLAILDDVAELVPWLETPGR